MLDTTPQQAVFLVSALSPSSYASAAKHKVQPLCGNSEGWGPLSPIRFDFTPCFLDVWIAAVAVYGILFGSGAIWYLMRKQKPLPVKENWHFYTKLVCLP